MQALVICIVKVVAAAAVLPWNGVPLAVDAQRYGADYDANEVGADARYKGRVLELTGLVTRVAKDGDGGDRARWPLADARCSLPARRP